MNPRHSGGDKPKEQEEEETWDLEPLAPDLGGTPTQLTRNPRRWERDSFPEEKCHAMLSKNDGRREP